MTAEKTSFSPHVTNDRENRWIGCATRIGWTKFVLEIEDTTHHNGTTKYLTDTGIIIIRDTASGRVVTGYMATLAQVKAMYSAVGRSRMPDAMYKRVMRNNKMHKDLLYIHD